mgnify:CR=1 FL=1
MTEINTALLPVRDFEVGDNSLSFDAAGNVVRVNTKASESFDSLTSAVAFVTANPSAIERLSTASYRSQAECTTLGIPYPDGGGADYIVRTGLAPTLGSVIDAGSSQLEFNSTTLDSRQFGVARGVTNNTERLIACSDYAYSKNIRTVTVDDDVEINAVAPELLLNNRANVIFVGDGKFSDVVTDGSAMYRRQVIPKTAPSALSQTDNNLDIKLRKLTNDKVIRVVFLGDSLSTSSANTLNTTSSKSVVFQKFIKECNPNYEFEFIQRSIGGKSLENINSTANSATIEDNYPWYTDPNREWLEYVYDVNPHIIIFASGTNDNSNLEPDTLFEVVSKIETNTEANIVFITNIGTVCSGVGDRVGHYLSEKSQQEGRDYAAGYYRSYAKAKGYPCIDLNRTFNMVRDGRDIISTEIYAATPLLTNGYLRADDHQACHDFSVELEVAAGAFTNTDPLAISLSSQEGNKVYIRDDGAGMLEAVVLTGSASAAFQGVFSLGIATPVGDYEFQCGVKGSEFFFKDRTNNGTRGDVVTIPVYRFGGLFKPYVGFNKLQSGPVIRGELNIGIPKPYMPQLTDEEMWGVVDGSYQDFNIGGNGINHPSSVGCAALYQAHYSKQIMRIDAAYSSSSTSQSYRTHSDGTVDIVGRVAMTDALTLVSLPFAVINPHFRATATKANGTAGTVSVSPSGSNSTTLALAGFTPSGAVATGFAATYHIIGATIL